MSDDRHQPFRDLLAERMDGPLSGADDARLEEHLVGCPACRSVAHDYETDRERMRAIRTPEPPRDLWARTSAALDREIAEDADLLLGPGLGGRRSHRQMRVAVGSFVTALVILALTGGQLIPEAPSGLATATPFKVPAQAVNFVGIANGELTFYRASVAEVCPMRRLDCADGPDGEPVVRLGSAVHASEMAMSRTGQLFISGRDDLGEEIFAIVTLPPASPSGASSSEATSPSPGAAVTSEPGATARPVETRNPDLGQGDPATAEPTDGPDILPSVTPDGAADPSAPGPSISPPPSPTTGVASSQAILSDVIATGAPAAWSPDGATLAFSAMPADRSQGSDVYIWRPGDEQAHPITDDHASLFASWSGPRVVVSRTSADASVSGDLIGQSVVVDPESGEGRPVDFESAWLPSVDPTGQFVIYWRGRLTDVAGVATPEDGRLYVADWTALDPWPSPRLPDGSPSTTESPADGSLEAPPDDDRPTAGSDATAGPDAPEGAVSSDGPSAQPSDPDSAASDGADATPADDAASSPPATPATSASPRSGPASFVLERPRAVSGRTRDWVVRWSIDGRAYAIWTAEPGSRTRGGLVVRSAPSADAPTGIALVDRVRAGRSFGLGNQRIAWVAPLASGDGELWVSVWGAGGPGSVKLRSLESMEAVPAY